MRDALRRKDECDLVGLLTCGVGDLNKIVWNFDHCILYYAEDDGNCCFLTLHKRIQIIVYNNHIPTLVFRLQTVCAKKLSKACEIL